MNLEQLLNLMPSEIGGYRPTITRYHDAFKGAEMWEVAYIGDKGKCLYCTAALTLEEAALQALIYMLTRSELNVTKGGEK